MVCIQSIVDREGVGEWDDALSIPDLSGVASALFLHQFSKHDLNCSKNQAFGAK